MGPVDALLCVGRRASSRESLQLFAFCQTRSTVSGGPGDGAGPAVWASGAKLTELTNGP